MNTISIHWGGGGGGKGTDGSCGAGGGGRGEAEGGGKGVVAEVEGWGDGKAFLFPEASRRGAASGHHVWLGLPHDEHLVGQLA